MCGSRFKCIVLDAGFTQNSRHKLVGLLKKGWNEIPAVMGTSCFALAGLGIYGYLVYREQTQGVHPFKYKYDLMVMRPDDPRLKRTLNTYPD